MATSVRGVVHGRRIDLHEEAGFPDGEEVNVTISPANGPEPTVPDENRERLRKIAGAWAEDADDLDAYLEWNRQRRKLGGRGADE